MKRGHVTMTKDCQTVKPFFSRSHTIVREIMKLLIRAGKNSLRKSIGSI